MASLRFTEGQSLPPQAISGARQLLPNVVDGMAAVRPGAIYAQIPRSFTSYAEGYRIVTYRHLANAVNGIAWLLTKQLGAGSNAETIAYYGPNDISYVVVILGASKAGYTVLSPSPQLSTEQYITLFKATHCNRILALSPPYSPALQDLLDHPDCQARVTHVPTVFELFDQTSPHYPYPQTYETAKDLPLVIVHSSGSTGPPKPLTYTHAKAAALIHAIHQPPPEGFCNVATKLQSNRVFAAYPFFHPGALFLALEAIASQTILVTPLAGAPLSTAGVMEALKLVEVEAMSIPAFMVEQIAKNTEWLELVAQRVGSVGYGGADVSDSAGEAFSTAGIDVISFYGSSETMTTPCVRRVSGEPPDTWHYLRPHPFVNARFEKRSGDGDGDSNGVSELIFVRNPDPDTQPVFHQFPELTEWRTGDLFSPHPQHPDLWRFRGRADDVIVAATGELCNPTAFEQRVSAIDGVEAALVVGTGRWQKALLIEPSAPASSVATPNPDQHRHDHHHDNDLIDRVWPAIAAAATALLSRTSQLARSHVLLTLPQRPLPRTGKGSVQRAAALALYAAQIDALYREHGDGADPRAPPLLLHTPMHV